MIRWDPYYVKSLTRFSDKGIIPALSAEQLRAAQILEDTCMRLSLHMILEIGVCHEEKPPDPPAVK